MQTFKSKFIPKAISYCFLNVKRRLRCKFLSLSFRLQCFLSRVEFKAVLVANLSFDTLVTLSQIAWLIMVIAFPSVDVDGNYSRGWTVSLAIRDTDAILQTSCDPFKIVIITIIIICLSSIIFWSDYVLIKRAHKRTEWASVSRSQA